MDYNKIIKKSLENLQSVLMSFPENYLYKTNIKKFVDLLNSDTHEKNKHLLVTSTLIFPFIIDEEKIILSESLIIDYSTLHLLLYISYYLYDKVLDNKETHLLPAANILFREFLLLSNKLGIDTSNAHNITEIYNYSPARLKIGKINMNEAKNFNNEWFKILEGFYIPIKIVDFFINKHIKNPNFNWKLFFEYYLLFRQISDDSNDFVEDYKNGELNSFGILALVNIFKNRKMINLKNPITSLQFQFYVLRNVKNIYDELINKFYNYIESNNLMPKVFNIKMEKIENSLFSD